eukprot:554240-Pleurochrysis_carterae.AAC.1
MQAHEQAQAQMQFRQGRIADAGNKGSQTCAGMNKLQGRTRVLAGARSREREEREKGERIRNDRQ